VIRFLKRLWSHRRGSRESYTVEAKRETAKGLKANGASYREIGRAMGISPSYAHKLVNPKDTLKK